MAALAASGLSTLPVSAALQDGQGEREVAGNEKIKSPGDSVTALADSSPEGSTKSDLDVTEKENAEVGRLARTLTQASGRSVGDGLGNPFSPEEGSALDPRSPKFSQRAWIKALLKFHSEDPERYPKRTAGFSFKNLNVHGFGNPTDYQKTVGNVWLEAIGFARRLMGQTQRKIQILRDFEGVVKSGEMLVVLGRPGSGCSTLLKTIAGETDGFYVDPAAKLNYQGIPADIMHKDFRGEVIYNAETEAHFPQLTVGQTLGFVAQARTPRNRLPGVSRTQYAEVVKDVMMTVFGLSHTTNTKVGNEYIRGVSGGERKRVSICEVALSGSPIQCWDNSTRGLDSANALEFCNTLRLSTDLAGATACVAIYQASQNAYDVFDKVILLYEGRQIYFGRAQEAKEFFTSMGFYCPARQTTADFLTSLTSPGERVVREGFEGKVPRTPDDFAEAWKTSSTRAELLREIEAFEDQHVLGGQDLEKFTASKKAQQAKGMRLKSPYTISIPMQIRLNMERGFQRLRGDMTLFLSGVFGNVVLALIIGSVFYNLPSTTASFYSRGALLFFAILMNAFSSSLEILTLWAQRPIVEKHTRYALYHPFTESISSMIVDLPSKILITITFNLTLYFMTNLRREVDAFFVFLLFSFACTMSMSMIFRSIGAASRTISQAMAPAAIFILALITYTGFTIPTRDMVVWFRWISYLNPIAYAFESLMINEFHNRQFPCNTFTPQGGEGSPYENARGRERVCATTGAIPGSNTVDGDAYINTSFQYYEVHLWRNLGIIFAIMIFFLFLYLVATEYISAAKSKGEVLLFPRGHTPAAARKTTDDEESNTSHSNGSAIVAENVKQQDVSAVIQRQTATFHWQDVCYDIKIKGEPRRLLDHVDGWVKPGTLTALMGVSGAGKTTLLDVLASRVTMGVVSGKMMIDGRLRDDSFQRKTGYVQQQDLHLQTTTVREALEFSAILRQPSNVSRKEKVAYVDEVIKLLEMQEYADAVVGVPGEGLNVDQRKRLTIGVELAAKPQLLLFLDEPTSGLDSQTAWSICDLMEKLTNSGQAILCTIHQPSPMLFQRFDRLLFLATGGKPVYFGEIGRNSEILTRYFESNGGHPCPPDANPAEWMLDVIGAAPGSHSEIDWHQVWVGSPERAQIRNELDLMESATLERMQSGASRHLMSYGEFASPFSDQLWMCLTRVFSQYWRSPTYLYSKAFLSIATSLFIGFSFYQAENSLQGLQNQMFAIFMLMTIFGNLVQQIMPHFVVQRALYEARERPSKSYSWKAFMLANIIVELPWNTLMGIFIFFGFYYPIGLYRNAVPSDAVHERGALMFLLLWSFLMFTSTFTNMVIAGIESAEAGGNIANLAFSLTLIFCGVLVSPTNLPGFWIFMYRLSPFTYLVSAMLSTGLANADVVCSEIEILTLDPPSGKSCGAYLEAFIEYGGGVLYNPQATSGCEFCQFGSTNTFLTQVSADFSTRWRNFGIMWAYILFNVCAALFLYWLARVPKKSKSQIREEEEIKAQLEQGI